MGGDSTDSDATGGDSTGGGSLCERETSYADLLARNAGPSTPPLMDGSRDFAGYCFMDDGSPAISVGGYLRVRSTPLGVEALIMYDKNRDFDLSDFDGIETRNDPAVGDLVNAAGIGDLTSQIFYPDKELQLSPTEARLNRTLDFTFRHSTECNTVLVQVEDPDPGDFISAPATICELDREIFD